MRRIPFVILALSTFLVASPATAESPGPAKVTQSRIAPVGDFPGQVALLQPGVDNEFQAQFCGGTQISADWVLTAAHCIDDGTLPDILIGATKLDNDNDPSNDTGTRVATTTSTMHPQFDFPINDIALLRLASPVSVAPFARLSFPGHEVLEIPGTVAFVTGWGGLSGDEDSQTFPEDLQVGDTPVIGDDVCNARLAAYSDSLPPGSEPFIVCAGEGSSQSTNQGDACRGDSGGPLWAAAPNGQRRQLGIVSGGPTCGFSPTYYTLVPAFIGFVETTTGLTLASFPDIAGNLLEPDIERIAVFGITTGDVSGAYVPAGQVTRGQMATFLARALQLTPVATGPFADVTGGGVHDGNINAVAAAGIASGFSDGTFKPDLPVNRAQMATFVARALGLTPLATGPFVDLAGFEDHAGNINAIAAAGIALVPADNMYRPGNPVTRAQMAAFLSRAFL